MKVLDTPISEFTHIIHFADVHIRSGDVERSRYEEYEHVFQNTIHILDTIEHIQQEKALIVIAGDLFHHKGKMDTPALKLYFSWMDQLLARAPVVMICGNHDFRQEDPRHPDMMETMSLPYESRRNTKFPLMYLKNTGHYQVGNVGFGVVSVRDTLRSFNTSGQVDQLPAYPTPTVFPTSCTARVALFHGTICQSALPNEQRMSAMNGYPLQWFDGYDMVLLGDNHKYQYHTKPQPWAYPGSLIQQDFGESTYGHGFLVWNLKKKSAVHHHVPNQYGMITVKWSEKLDTFAVLLGRRDVCDVATGIARENFPKMPRVRIIGGHGDDMKVQALFEEHQIRPTSMILSSSIEQVSLDESADGNNAEDVREKIVNLADLNEPTHWMEYLHGVAPELDDVVGWFTRPESLCATLDDTTRGFLPKDVLQKINDRNARIQKAIDEYRDKVQEKHTKYRISLQHMSWDYAMCYGQGNYFDFKNIQNSIALLNGRNASGKSSFLDVLCIGLFGEPTKHRNMLSGKKMTSKMIHDHRPANKSVMKVAILCAIDQEEYEIVRSFTTQKKDDQSVYAQLHSARIYKLTPEAQKEMIAEGSVMVEQWITTYFGSIEDMLMSTILCQLDISNFFYLKQDEQKAILDHAMQLGSITSFAKIIKEATLAYNEWITLLRTALQAMGEGGGATDLATPQEIAKMEDTVSQLQSQLQEKQEEYKRLLGDIGVLTSISQLSEKDITSQEKKLLAKLSNYADIEDKSMESVYSNKGEAFTRYTQCQEAMNELLHTIDEVQPQTMPSQKECMGSLKQAQTDMEKHKRMEKLPSVSKDYLQKLKKDLGMWRSQFPEEWVEDPDQVEIMAQELRDSLAKKRNRLQVLQKNAVSKPIGKQPNTLGSVDKGAASVEEVKKKQEELTQSLKDLSSQQQQLTLWRDMEKYDKWRAEWKKWKHDVAAVEKEEDTAETLAEKCTQYEEFIASYKAKQEEWERVMREITEIEKELELISEIPLNQDCWACKLQPAMKRKEQLSTMYDRLRRTCTKAGKYMRQYEEHGDVASLENDLKAQRKLYASRLYYEQTKEHMENEHKIWAETKQRAQKLAVLQEEVEAIETELAENTQLLSVLQWEQWTKWNTKVEQLEKAVVECDAQLQEMDAFLKEYDLRDKDMTLLQVETDKYENHEAWQEKEITLVQQVQLYEKMVQYWDLHTEFVQLQNNLGDHAKLIQRMQEKEQLNSDMERLQKSRLRNLLQEVERDMNGFQEKYDATRLQLALAQKAFKRNADKRDQLVWYTERIDEWTERKGKLVLLESKFIGDKTSSDGYKEWIYREKVVPLLETEVNRFLSTIESIRLKIQYDKKCFTYFLEDRGNLPTLDKASGYQNFVVGLAMRLALSRIGAVGQNVRHLFIDEGFTACDVANIEKVPQLLRGVMSYGGYDSIVIMSHLEQVQEASDCRIDIERRGMFSFVHFGDEYPSIPVKKEEPSAVQNATTTQKKRGRPKKQEE